MRALLVTKDNLPELQEQFKFEEFPHTEEDPEKGTYVDHVEYETDNIIGKYLVVDNFWPRGFGVVSPDVFKASFVILKTDGSEWFECSRKNSLLENL